MRKYRVSYTEVYTGFKEIEANSVEEAMGKVTDLIECDELVPSEEYDGHETTVDYAEEVDE